MFLVWIGHQVEDLYGSKEYLAYFALTSLLGGVAYTVGRRCHRKRHALAWTVGGGDGRPDPVRLALPDRHRFFFIPIWSGPGAIYALVDIAGLADGHANPAAVAVHLAGAAFAFAVSLLHAASAELDSGPTGTGHDRPPGPAAEDSGAARRAPTGASHRRFRRRGGRGGRSARSRSTNTWKPNSTRFSKRSSSMARRA